MTHTLTQKLFRPLIALSLATSIALSPVAATPAHAGNDDTAKFIGALIALGLIGVAINNNNQNVRPTPNPRPPVDARAKRLPASCLNSYDTRRGAQTLFFRGCLVNEYRHTASLPTNCAKRIRFRNSRGRMVTHNTFRPNCLTNQGFKINYNR